MTRVVRLFILAVISTAIPPVLAAQSPVTVMNVAEALDAPQLVDTPIDLSPDGAWVAYTVQRRLSEIPHVEQESWFSPAGVPRLYGIGGDIWISNTRTGELRNLTNGQGSNWQPAWSPDGRALAFYSDRDGAARLYVWTQATGVARRVADAIVRPVYDGDTARWSPDGASVLVKLLPEGSTLGEAALRLNATSLDRATVDRFHRDARMRVYTARSGAPERSVAAEADQSVSLIERELVDLGMIEIASGAVRRLARRVPVRWYALSPDGRTTAFTTVTRLTLAMTENRHDLRVVPSAGGTPRVLLDDIARAWWGMSAAWSPDGAFIAVISSYDKDSRALIVPAVGGAVTEIAGMAPLMDVEQPPLWSRDGTQLFVAGTQEVWEVATSSKTARRIAALEGMRIRAVAGSRRAGAPGGIASDRLVLFSFRAADRRSCVHAVDLASGQIRALREDEREYGARTASDTSDDGAAVVIVSESASEPPEVWGTDQGFGSLRKVSNVQPDVTRASRGTSHLIHYNSYDGQPLSAAVLLPADYQKDTRYPLIVYVYSGARLSDRLHHWGVEGTPAQLLASRGYAVMFVDIPTRGDNEMRNIAKMVLPSIEKIVDLGIADGDRIGVMGESHGSYTVLSLIVQSTRFKAAVTANAQGSLFSDYFHMRPGGSGYNTWWHEEGPHALGGTPWEVRHRYIENSPLFYLDRVQTPLLIVQGDADQSLPTHLSAQVFVGLRRLGRAVEFVVYDGQEHSPRRWTLGNRVDYACRAIRWFEQHLSHREQPDTNVFAGCEVQ